MMHWIALVSGLLLLVVANERLLRWRRRLRRASRLLGSGAHEGILRASEPIVTVMPPGNESPVRAVLGGETRPFGEAWVELPSERKRLELDGALQVVIGSIERTSDEGVVHVAESGDPVIVWGKIERRAEATDNVEGGYREPAESFRLTGDAKAPPVLLSLKKRRETRGMGTTALGVLLFGAGLFGLIPQDRSCVERIHAMFLRNDILGIEALAATCHEPSVDARVSFLRGDFPAAHVAFRKVRSQRPETEPTVAEIQSAALAGAFDTAAVLTKRLGESWYRAPAARGRRRFDCISDAYATRAKKVRVGTLRREYEPFSNEPWCQALSGDLDSDSDHRAAALQERSDDRRTNELLAMEAMFVVPILNEYLPQEPLEVLDAPSAWLTHSHVALEDSIARRSGLRPIEPDWYYPNIFLAQAALFRAVMGQDAEARAFLQLVVKSPPLEVAQIAAIASFYIRDVDEQQRFLSVPKGSDYRSNLKTIELEARMSFGNYNARSGDPELADALDNRNAGRVAALFAKDGKVHRFEALLARAQLGTQLLEPLREWLRKSFPSPKWDRGLLAVGLNLGDRLAIAEAFEDTELVALLRPRVDAFAKALTSRELSERMTDVTLPNDLLERTEDNDVVR